jgi:hypothetical protein
MTKPEQFILNSDYATLKNDARNTIQITIPGSMVISASSTYSNSTIITLGTIGAAIRSRINSNKDPSLDMLGSSVSYSRTGTSGGGPALYDVLACVTRESSTTVRLTVLIRNPYGATLTLAAGSEIITADINTFLSPYA